MRVQEELVSIEWKHLHRKKIADFAPFKIKLANNQYFIAEKIIRFLPAKRVTVFGIWEGKAVVAKLFFHRKRAKKHAAKDVIGINRLRDANLNTCALLYQSKCADPNMHILFLEKIIDAKNLQEIWHETKNVSERLAILQTVIAEIAKLHRSDLMQNDLNFKNFVFAKTSLYTIDGTNVKHVPHCSHEIMLDNLASFFAFFSHELPDAIKCLYQHYLLQRQISYLEKDFQYFLLMIEKHRQKNWRRHQYKIISESSDFTKIKNAKIFAMCDRHYASAQFMDLLINLHQFTKNYFEEEKLVQTFQFLDKKLVVQIYQQSQLFAFLRNLFSKQEAYTAWCVGQAAYYHDKSETRPVAFVVKRWFFVPVKSFYVYEVGN